MKLRNTILSLAMLAAVSCSSPLDVPANREEYIDNAKSNSLLSTSPTTINFGYVNRLQDVKMPFQITNMNTMAFSLNSIKFSEDSQFSIVNKDLPDTIGKKGTASSIQLFHVRFFSSTIGEFSDSLRTNGLTNPKLIVQAIVPDIFCADVSFGSVAIGDTVSSDLMIYNYTDQDLVVESIKFSEDIPNFFYKLDSEIVIPAYQKTGKPGIIPVYFQSERDGLYEATAEIVFKNELLGKLVKNTVMIEAATL